MEGERLRHPRAVAAFRVGLYVAVAMVLVLLALTAMGTLAALALAGTVLALAVGQSGLLAVGGVALAGLLVGGATVAGVVVGARRLERRVVAADRRPDPLEAVKDRYVRGDVDEGELEAHLEAVLDGPRERRGRRTGGATTGPDRESRDRSRRDREAGSRTPHDREAGGRSRRDRERAR